MYKCVVHIICKGVKNECKVFKEKYSLLWTKMNWEHLRRKVSSKCSPTTIGKEAGILSYRHHVGRCVLLKA